MKLLFVAFIVFTFCAPVWAQKAGDVINEKEVLRIESMLASDAMRGRKTFSKEIDIAAAFIETEFKKAGLKHMDGLTSFCQSFSLRRAKFVSAEGSVDSKIIAAENIIAVTVDSLLTITENSGYEMATIAAGDNLTAAAAGFLQQNKKLLVLVDESFAKNFSRLKGFKREMLDYRQPVVFVLAAGKPTQYAFTIKHSVSNQMLQNVVGILPGKTKKNEYVIFSGHYDHIGVGKANAAGDSIFNGANDDAAGTTAVMMLANHFSKLANNERTIIFAAFTGEEIGGYGSKYFSKQLDADKIVAMFNIEMIGTESKWGKNSAFITGYEKSDFGSLLQQQLSGTGFTFYPDPYPTQNLFYRSDNANLAALGVPAHTISTSKMDNEPNYHQQSDELATLDIANMTAIIKAIALSSKGIVNGTVTPSRVERLK